MTPKKRTPEATAALRSTLLESARQVIARAGADALTMRSLAAEAGCALGLPYKVFNDRGDLIAELAGSELERLIAVGNDLLERAGKGTLTSNLTWFASAILDSPAVALASEVMSNRSLADRFARTIGESGVGPDGFQTVFAKYLSAEQEQGRVETGIDVDALGFFLAGAIHNLVVSGPAYPRPSRSQLANYLDTVSNLIEQR